MPLDPLGLLELLFRNLHAPEERNDQPGDPEPDDLGIETIGAWVGRASMSSPRAIRQAVEFARGLGLGRLDVIVNDDAEERGPIPFRTYPKDQIVALADAANAAGIAVHLMSWLMPHEGYIEGAAESLRRLVEHCDACSVVFDAEEPWTLARQRLPYDKAAELIETRFEGVRLGVTGIGYAPAEKLHALARVCDYLVPQCYATSTSHIDPPIAVPRFSGRWRRVFGADREIVVGLAAYRQTGIDGWTPETAMRAAFAGAEADPEAREVVYWSLDALRASPRIAKVVRELAKRVKISP